MSSTFLYREEIRFMQKEVKGQLKPVNYVYHVGQYLPDWHPWENYKDFFVGDKRTNGCREIMAIELPWLIETFGAVKRVSVMHDKMSQLNVEYDDNYMIQLVHENGNKGVIVVDIVCPRAVRNLEVYSEDTYMSWNGRPDGLKKYDRKKDDIENIMLYDYVEHKSGYQSTIIENAYADEIEEFLDVIAGKSAQTYGFEKDAKVLEWLDCIEG